VLDKISICGWFLLCLEEIDSLSLSLSTIYKKKLGFASFYFYFPDTSFSFLSRTYSVFLYFPFGFFTFMLLFIDDFVFMFFSFMSPLAMYTFASWIGLLLLYQLW
jgi:hypothetical protein